MLGYALLAAAAVWGAMALHFDGPDPGWLREGLAVGFAAVDGARGVAMPPPSGGIACGLLFGAVLFWWLHIAPSNDRDWEPEYARLASVTRDGDRFTCATSATSPTGRRPTSRPPITTRPTISTRSFQPIW